MNFLTWLLKHNELHSLNSDLCSRAKSLHPIKRNTIVWLSSMGGRRWERPGALWELFVVIKLTRFLLIIAPSLSHLLLPPLLLSPTKSKWSTPPGHNQDQWGSGTVRRGELKKCVKRPHTNFTLGSHSWTHRRQDTAV